MKKRRLFVIRYLIAFVAPTVFVVLRYRLYESASALYLVGILTCAIAAIAVCKWLLASENSSIPREYQYVPGMLRLPLTLIAAMAVVWFAVGYTRMLVTVLGAYFIGVIASIPATVAYNKALWEAYKQDFGRSGGSEK